MDGSNIPIPGKDRILSLTGSITDMNIDLGNVNAPQKIVNFIKTNSFETNRKQFEKIIDNIDFNSALYSGVLRRLAPVLEAQSDLRNRIAQTINFDNLNTATTYSLSLVSALYSAGIIKKGSDVYNRLLDNFEIKIIGGYVNEMKQPAKWFSYILDTDFFNEKPQEFWKVMNDFDFVREHILTQPAILKKLADRNVFSADLDSAREYIERIAERAQDSASRSHILKSLTKSGVLPEPIQKIASKATELLPDKGIIFD